MGKTYGEMLRSTAIVAHMRSQGFGLCPRMDEPDDLLMFIGPRVNPVHSYETVGMFEEYANEALKMHDMHPKIEANRMENGPVNSKKKRNARLRLAQRLAANPQRLRSEIIRIVVFVNAVTYEDFQKLMEKIELKPIGDNQYCVDPTTSSKEALWWKGIIVKHVQGDAAEVETLRPVIMDHTIDASIVLRHSGQPQPRGHTQGHARDEHHTDAPQTVERKRRRRAHAHHRRKHRGHDREISLGEARPELIHNGERFIEYEPDFVNQVAVIARALVQTLAYPLIDSARSELFDDDPDSAQLVTVHTSEYVPVDTNLRRRRAAVLRAKGEHSICLGVLWADGTVELLKKQDDPVRFVEDDRLIVLRRWAAGFQGADGVVEFQNERARERGCRAVHLHQSPPRANYRPFVVVVVSRRHGARSTTCVADSRS